MAIVRLIFVALALCIASCSSMTAPGGTDSGFVSSNGTMLKWYLDFPRGDGPFPAVVFGPGSGNVAADNRHTIRYARGLNDLGFAVMRYDKRGTGESDGTIPSLSTSNSLTVIPTLASDMSAVFDVLVSNPKIDKSRLGLFGASQANWYMPVVADNRDEVTFMVVMTGGVLPVGMQNRYEELTRIQGQSPEDAEALLGLLEDFTGDLGFSQIPILERLDIPMLYLRGGSDIGLPNAASTVVMDSLIIKGVDLEYEIYPSGTHLLPDTNFWPDLDEWIIRKDIR